MAYQLGDTITAAGVGEYNDFVGASGTSVYASQVAIDAASPAVGAIYGAGFGNRGYGQAIVLSTVSAGTIITSAQWTNMRDALAAVRDHQTGAVPALVPPTTVLEVGDVIQAHEVDPPSSDAFDFNSEIAAADTNRFVMDASSAGSFATTGTSSNTRGSSWGGGGSGSIDLEFDVTFTSEDETRYFFNSGGEIRITLTHPAGTAQDNDWQTSLQTRLGRVDFNYTNTTSQGSSGLSSGIGYYDLTGSYQTIINGANLGGGAYTTNDVLIEALRTNFVGANGANGRTVRFRITLTDQHTNTYFDSVASGTAASFAVLKSVSLTGIETPAGSVTNAF